MRSVRGKPSICYGNILLIVYLLAVSLGIEAGPIPSGDQLTEDDVNKIVELIGQTPEASASDPVPTVTSILENGTVKPLQTILSSPAGTTQTNHLQASKEVSLQILKDAQVALFADLIASQAGVSPQKPIKQQDFSSFQNAEPILDQSSNNQLGQLGDALNLLGTLGSLAGPVTSLLSLGGQQSNPLAGLIGGQSGNLLSGILGLGASQLKSQAPELMSSLGNFASVLGGAIRGPKDGKPKLRGVDTRLGLGYRMGENADAQLVFEIGPQLFTEPLTDEQKNLLLLQQQQQQILNLQRLQQQQNPNGRQQGIQKRQLSTQDLKEKPKSNLWRRHISVIDEVSSLNNSVSKNRPKKSQPNYYRRVRPDGITSVNAYPGSAGSGGSVKSPVSSVSSNLVLMELTGSNGNYFLSPVLSPQQPQRRKNNFTFSKDKSNHIVRVSVTPRQYSRFAHVSVIHPMDDINNVMTSRQQVSMNPVKLQNRMGLADNSAIIEKRLSTLSRSSAKESPMIVRSTLRQKKKKQQPINSVRVVYQRPKNAQPETDKESGVQTLSEWSEKNSFFDLVQNYVVDRVLNDGNKIVNNLTSDKKFK